MDGQGLWAFELQPCTRYQYLVMSAMATKNTSIALGEELANYARRKVESGAFGSTSEVVRDAMRRAAERDARIEHLRELIREGEESGPAQPFDFDEFLKEMRANYKSAA